MKKLSDCMHRISDRNWVLLALAFIFLCTLYISRLAAIASALFVFPLGYGSLLRMFSKREVVIDRFTVLLVIVCGFLGLSALLNRKIGLTSISGLLGFIVCILYPAITPKDADPHALRREMTSLSALFIVFLTPFVLLSVASVFLGKTFTLPLSLDTYGTGINLPVGRIRILGNSNPSAMYCVIGVLFAIYLLHQKLPRFVRALLIAAILLFAMGLAHTQSRTSTYAFAVSMGAIAGHLFYRRFRGGKGSAIAALAIWVVCSVLCFLLLLELYWVDVEIAARLTGTQAEVSRILSDGILDLSKNGRGLIWRTGLRYLRQNPKYLLFGMGPSDIMKRIAAISPEPFDSMAHLHNAFLELCARGGIFSMLCMVAAMALMIRPCLRLLAAPDAGGDRGAYILAVYVGAFLLISLTEVPIFASQRIENFLFFFVAGHVMRLSREKKLG